MSNTILEADVSKFLKNVEKIREFVSGKEIMPVFKANAYGTYLNRRLDILNLFSIIAVAKVEEAVVLRDVGYQKDIFLLNQPSLDEIELIYKYDLIVGVSELSFLSNVHLPLRVHLEIETGMNRTGFFLEDLEKVVSILSSSNISVEGVYTHFSSADCDVEYTKRQISTFRKAVAYLEKFYSFRYIHSSASSGLLNYDDGVSNLVRPGLLLYGFEPYLGAYQKIGVEPILTFKSRITYLKSLREGEAIGYGQSFVTKHPSVIATIPVGYADGLRRELSNSFSVWIHGKRCPIVGNICMDSCMIDVSSLDVKVGDSVILFDDKNILVTEMAEKCHTISYEILSTISDRVKRVYMEDIYE